MTDRIPPNNIDYECSLIASCLAGDAHDVVDALPPGVCYRPAHEKILSAIRSLASEKLEINIVTISNRLRDLNQLEECGGAAYLSNIIDEYPIAVKVDHYAQEVIKKYERRKIIEICAKGEELAHDISVGHHELVDSIQSKILNLGIRCSSDFCKVSDDAVSIADEIETRSQSPNDVTGIGTGFKKLDMTLMGYQNSDFIILAARPSMGKTAMMLNQVCAINFSHRTVGVFSLEMSRKQIEYRIISQLSGISMYKLMSGRIKKDEWQKVNDAMAKLSKFKVLIDDTGGLPVQEFRTRARRMRKEGVSIFFVDYLQLMVCDGQSREREISTISGSLKATAKELDVPIVALSQLNRKLEERGNKRPIMSDLRDSGSLEQDADIIMFLFRMEQYITNKFEKNGSPTRAYAEAMGKAELNIAKHRNGPTGVVYLDWDEQSTSFRDRERAT